MLIVFVLVYRYDLLPSFVKCIVFCYMLLEKFHHSFFCSPILFRLLVNLFKRIYRLRCFSWTYYS